MKKNYCDLIRIKYAGIGSGDIGYISDPVSYALETLNEIAANQILPTLIREQAAFAAANLLISDDYYQRL